MDGIVERWLRRGSSFNATVALRPPPLAQRAQKSHGLTTAVDKKTPFVTAGILDLPNNRSSIVCHGLKVHPIIERTTFETCPWADFNEH